MIFFSGFLFKNEQKLFEKYLIDSEFTIAGFSLGAIRAFNETVKKIQNGERVDNLQLFSPSFFQNKDKSFARIQIYYFKNNQKDYIDSFLKNAFYPNNDIETDFLTDGNISELEELLNFKWNQSELNNLVTNGVNIELYIGSKDIIIDSQEAFNFFKEFSTVYLIKNVGHVLK